MQLLAREQRWCNFHSSIRSDISHGNHVRSHDILNCSAWLNHRPRLSIIREQDNERKVQSRARDARNHSIDCPWHSKRTHHVDCDFSDFRCAMGFAEVLDAFLLLWNFISHDALQIGAVAGDVADACHDSRPVFLFGMRDIFRCKILINRSRVWVCTLFTPKNARNSWHDSTEGQTFSLPTASHRSMHVTFLMRSRKSPDRVGGEEEEERMESIT